MHLREVVIIVRDFYFFYSLIDFIVVLLMLMVMNVLAKLANLRANSL